MTLNQAATGSLVQALQHGVETMELVGVRLHLQTLMEYDGRGRCGEMTCDYYTWDWDTYRKEMKTWAARVNWYVSGNIVRRGKIYCM